MEKEGYRIQSYFHDYKDYELDQLKLLIYLQQDFCIAYCTAETVDSPPKLICYFQSGHWVLKAMV